MKQDFSFSALGSITSKVVNFVGFIVLARLLTPEDFGVFALLMIVFSLSGLFIEMGLGAALIHFRNPSELHYSTAGSVSLMISLLLMLLCWVSADAYASFFSKTELSDLLKLFSCIFIMSAFSVVPYTKLQKNNSFKKIAIADITSVLLSWVTAIYSAYSGAGIYALLFQKGSQILTRTVLLLFLANVLPRFKVGRKQLIEFWDYTKYLVVFRLLNFGVGNADSVAVGKTASTSALGEYNFSYQLLTFSRSVVASIFNPVQLSNYANFQENSDIVAQNHLRVCKLVGLVVFPLNGLLYVCSDWIVVLLLNDSWLTAAEYIRFFCVITLFYPITMLNGPVFLASGNTKSQLNMGLSVMAFTLVAIVLGATFTGVYGVLAGLFVSSIVSFGLSFWYAFKILNVSFVSGCVDVAQPLIPTLLTTLVVYFSLWLSDPEVVFFNLVSIALVYLGVYVVVLYLFAHELAAMLIKFLKSGLKSY